MYIYQQKIKNVLRKWNMTKLYGKFVGTLFTIRMGMCYYT